MPTVAAWVDQLRAAFGTEEINAAIRAGQQGKGRFYAVEAGHAIGTPFMSEHIVWRGEGLASRHFCAGCSGQCVGTDQLCKSRQETAAGRLAPGL